MAGATASLCGGGCGSRGPSTRDEGEELAGINITEWFHVAPMAWLSGDGGHLDCGNFPMAIKRWEIQWNKPALGLESWYGKLTVTKTDYSAMMSEKAKSGPFDVIKLMDKPRHAEFHSERKVYFGEVLISQFPNLLSFPLVISFKGTGPLNEGSR